MAIQNKYQTEQAPNFSVDYFDYISNTGYKTFYFAGASLSGSILQHFLTSDSGFISDDNNYRAGSANINFDLEFKAPAVIGGTAEILIPMLFTGSQNIKMYATISHVRGAVITQIGYVEMETKSATSAVNKISSSALTLTKKGFSIGDILRVNLISTASASCEWYFDPSGHITLAGTGSTNSRSTIIIPFKLPL